jgi:phytanoyl-CoA hydroxylase
MKNFFITSFAKKFSVKSIENIVTNSKIQQFKEEGYTVFPNVFSKDYIEELKGEVEEIISKANLNELKTKFDTDHGSSEDYFLDSGDKIRFFLEQDALDKSGNFNYPINKSINKIGHGMHDLNKKFKKFSYSREIKYIVSSIGYKRPSIVQSMYIFKNERIGGEVPPHTDNTYIITNPLSCMVIFYNIGSMDSI